MDEKQLVELAVRRQEAMLRYEELTDDLRIAVLAAISAGDITELRVARLTGLSRTTVRVWLGKA